MITTMQAQAHIVVDEQVSSGPNSSAHGSSQLSGSTFIEGEPYAPDTSDVHQLPPTPGLTNLVVYLPGSHIWVRLAIDGQHLLRQEVIVDPGHFIQRTFSYP
jgi:copper transport protein